MKYCILSLVICFSFSAFSAKAPVTARRGLLLSKGATTLVLSSPQVTALVLLNLGEKKMVDLNAGDLVNDRWTAFELIDRSRQMFARGFARVIGRHTFHLVSQLAKQTPRPTLESLRNVIDALEHPCEPMLVNDKSAELLVIEDQAD